METQIDCGTSWQGTPQKIRDVDVEAEGEAEPEVEAEAETETKYVGISITVWFETSVGKHELYPTQVEVTVFSMHMVEKSKHMHTKIYVFEWFNLPHFSSSTKSVYFKKLKHYINNVVVILHIFFTRWGTNEHL